MNSKIKSQEWLQLPLQISPSAGTISTAKILRMPTSGLQNDPEKELKKREEAIKELVDRAKKLAW